ncbi:hypothetical protein SCYAM73S_06081 [Streptomyces cyaneofuscatus]
MTSLTAIKPRWCGTPPSGPGSYTAQLRAHGGETEVTAELVDGSELHVTFTEPVRGVAPGQAVVLYDRQPGRRLGHHRDDGAARGR